MAKTFFFKFASGDPRPHTGLSPTFLIFVDQNGANPTPPTVSEAMASSGIYKFTYTPTLAIAFLIDGFTSGLSSSDRYITNSLDPVQTVDQNISSGFSLLGSASDSFGSTSSDPSTIFGYLKRLLENLEGNSNYTKSTNVWNIYTRGSSTLLISKTLTDNQNSTTKT